MAKRHDEETIAELRKMMGIEELPEETPEDAVDLDLKGLRKGDYYHFPEEDPFARVKDHRKRTFLRALAAHGNRRDAAFHASVAVSTTHGRHWSKDPQFRAGYEKAMEIFEERRAEELEAEAYHRAVEGLRQYKFTAGGESVAHPEECLCGHSLSDHSSPGQACGVEGCECEAFAGRPYYEAKKSDRMLAMLLEGALPEKYSKRVEFKGAMANLDLAKLPNEAIARIASGENPMAVLASMAEGAGKALPAPQAAVDDEERD